MLLWCRLFLRLRGWPCTEKTMVTQCSLHQQKSLPGQDKRGKYHNPPTHTNTQLPQSLLCKFFNKTKPVSIELGVLLFGRNRNPAITEVQHQPVTIQTSYTSEDKIFHNTLDRSCRSSGTMLLSFFPRRISWGNPACVTAVVFK